MPVKTSSASVTRITSQTTRLSAAEKKASRNCRIGNVGARSSPEPWSRLAWAAGSETISMGTCTIATTVLASRCAANGHITSGWRRCQTESGKAGLLILCRNEARCQYFFDTAVDVHVAEYLEFTSMNGEPAYAFYLDRLRVWVPARAGRTQLLV